MFDFSKIKENPVITKEGILSSIREKQIMEKYIGGSIDDSPILSPLRTESNPSFTIKECDDGSIIWRDWGTGKHGDCFNFIQEKYNCTFTEALNIINTDFNLNDSNDVSSRNAIRLDSSREDRVKEKPIIIIKEQPFTLADKRYWGKYGIKLSTLVLYDVFSVKNLWLFKSGKTKLSKLYNSSNPIYAYRYVNYKYYTYKIYQPLEKKYNKWVFNGSKENIEGYDQLPMYGDLLIITKSLKDVMCYYELGIPAISLQGETNKLEHEFLEKLKSRFNKIIINYDNDLQGRNAVEGYTDDKNKFIDGVATMHNLRYFYINEAKDLSDTIEKYGIEESKNIIRKLIDGCNS
jgi:hypothetical protein